MLREKCVSILLTGMNGTEELTREESIHSFDSRRRYRHRRDALLHEPCGHGWRGRTACIFTEKIAAYEYQGWFGSWDAFFRGFFSAIWRRRGRSVLSTRTLLSSRQQRQSTICELTFVSAILAVKLNRKRLVVVLEEHIYIYDISNMKLLQTIDTNPNPTALCALSPSSENSFLAYPSQTGGTTSSAAAAGELLIFDALTLQASTIIQAHKTALSAVAFSFDGTMVATSSDKGTVIRVFSVPGGETLHQFRRGTYPARIHSLAFDMLGNFLAVSSDTDTIHVFRLNEEQMNNGAEGQPSTGGSLGGKLGGLVGWVSSRLRA